MDKNLALAMIVKNEARVIRRCLESVKPFISYWVISDTGSTDGTQDIIREVMADIPGELVENQWVNWAVNRSIPLAIARERSGCRYTLAVLDADEVLTVKDEAVLDSMNGDAFMVMRRLGRHELGRVSIFNNRLPWVFEGEKHESHSLPGMPHVIQDLPGVLILNLADGASGWDPVKSVERYSNEALEFEQKLKENPRDTRSQYYLAQSYADSLQNTKAVDAYLKRATMGGWNEEIYVSLLRVAQIKADYLGAPKNQVILDYLEAHRVIPERGEAIYYLGRHLREIKNDYVLAEIFLRQAATLKRPSCSLLVEPEIYEWRAKDELMVALTWTGKWQEALVLVRFLLENGPSSERTRYEGILKMCLDNGAMDVRIPKAETATEKSASEKRAAVRLVRLNLGCGDALLRGYVNVDREAPADVIQDLDVPWSAFEDSSVDEILAAHVFEYLKDPIFVMNEAYRVLKPGGVLELSVGSALGDPKVRSMWTRESLNYYLGGTPEHTACARRYGIVARFTNIQETKNALDFSFGFKLVAEK